MTNIGYIKEFSKGPCSPVVIIPGITGSKLEAEVSCEVLKEKNPDLFKQCGWENCDSKDKSPKSTYMVWVPKPTSSSFKLYKALRGSELKCYTTFLKLVVNERNDVLKLEDATGLKIRAYGSVGKRSDTKCGFEAIENLLPILPSAM